MEEHGKWSPGETRTGEHPDADRTVTGLRGFVPVRESRGKHPVSYGGGWWRSEVWTRTELERSPCKQSVLNDHRSSPHPPSRCRILSHLLGGSRQDRDNCPCLCLLEPLAIVNSGLNYPTMSAVFKGKQVGHQGHSDLVGTLSKYNFMTFVSLCSG